MLLKILLNSLISRAPWSSALRADNPSERMLLIVETSSLTGRVTDDEKRT